MNINNKIFCISILSLSIIGCGNASKLERLNSQKITAALSLPDEHMIDTDDYVSDNLPVERDTMTVLDESGNEVIIMKAIKNENGEMIATDVISAATVTARFRNVAERHGKVDLQFQITIPEEMQDPHWQLRLYPQMHILGESTTLEPVFITGQEYRHVQLKGYQQYEKFLASIVSDSTRFINIRLLEVFIERNIPELYAFKSDSSYVSDKEFASVYGVTEQEATEHYTKKHAKRMNNRRKASIDKMYRKFVKIPIEHEGLRLDTIINSVNGSFTYLYTHTISTRPKLRKAEIVLSGTIYEQGRKLYDIPETSPLTFYISSISSLTDNTEKYKTHIIERRVEASTACYVSFDKGKAEINLDLGHNRSEVGRIRQNLGSLIENKVFDLDSIVVTASSSPEGNIKTNRHLTQRRSESVSDFFKGYIEHYQDSLRNEVGFTINLSETAVETYNPIRFIARNDDENWDMLDALIAKDSVLTMKDKMSYIDICEIDDLDKREEALQSQSYYRHIREKLYPRLRIVRFDFHLHRKGMIKDTVHTTILDEEYMAGVQAIRDRDYETAITILRPYQDYNSAVAYCAMNYNASAMAILERLQSNDRVDYLKAIIYARMNDEQKAVQYFMNSCTKNPSYIHRGNLDPEISGLIKKYNLMKHLSAKNSLNL